MKTTKKRFDCVAMKRKGGAAVYEATRGMSLEQELAFWREQETRLLASGKRSRRKKLRSAQQLVGPSTPEGAG